MNYSYMDYKRNYPQTLDYIEELIEWRPKLTFRKLSAQERDEIARKLIIDLKDDIEFPHTENLLTDLQLFIGRCIGSADYFRNTFVNELIKNYQHSIEGMFEAAKDYLEYELAKARDSNNEDNAYDRHRDYQLNSQFI